ncbi:hypothetical protein SteCoe_36319 [Stentor coeruleus]|uniref:Enoyl reductase (ER) domain-containing protein n=1 Tax=Stentor coeruleus TaxID=5963 RepID=A0A1R2AQE3_9CILI|nr:hypothetical protein SteCoe_36319 [Stentor coeruleus]
MVSTFSALRINTKGSIDELHIEERTIPELTEGQLLIKMEYSTINPSDYLNLLGHYPGGNAPLTGGFEGSGVVIKSGGGAEADTFLNKRVTLLSAGTWAEYIVTDTNLVFPLLDSIPLESAASLNINPLTVALFIEKVKGQKTHSFIQNAAASALGKQFIRWANRLGLVSINLVRRQEQVDLLKAIGAEHVINTSEDGWKEKTKELCKSFGVTCGFDAIGGTSTSDIADVIGNGGVVYNYGLLSGKSCEIGPNAMIFEGKRLEGLWLIPWMFSKTYQERYQVSLAVQQNIDILGTEYNQTVTLPNVKAALALYMQNSTNNKVLIRTTL